ncbi:MAG: L-fucose/L-arabinose isomerase family protein [Bacillota bacterium]
MKKQVIRLGYAPTRRDVFSRQEAGKFREAILAKIRDLGGGSLEVVDIDWLNDEGLLYSDSDVEKVAKAFRDQGVDAVFSPHCNFGTESAVAKLGHAMGKPFLLWGPRDDAPLPDGARSRDTQCGLFATSKILARYDVPFTYIVNSCIDSPVFENGFRTFLQVSSVVKEFRQLRIGQIGPRPAPFWSVMCDEGDLLEKFGIQIVPASLPDLDKWTREAMSARARDVSEYVEDIKSRLCTEEISEPLLEKLAAMRIAMQDWAESESLSAIAIQCWDSLQDVTGIMPCFANAELTDIGIPVVCETDIHGAVTAALLQASRMGESAIFFADLTVRHPTNDNAELLWHCGPFPYSLKAADSPGAIGRHFIKPTHCPGVAEWEIKGGDVTIARFDGMRGKYSLFMGHAKGTTGPKNRGTYIWVEVNDWPLWEERLIRGPYIHHVVGIHGSVAPVLYEACRYIPGLIPDAVDPSEEEIRRMLRG